jgi:hypothetical protein
MALSLRDHLSPSGLDKWVAELGCAHAPVPREGIRTALRFFDGEMPTLPIAEAVAFLAGMDLSKPVRRVLLQPGERLIAFRQGTESPFKLFFARRGQSSGVLGINTAGRGVVHFVVRSVAPALESSAAGAIDTWTPRQPGQRLTVAPRARKWFGREFGIMATAGGGQLVVPESYSHLLVEQRP